MFFCDDVDLMTWEPALFLEPAFAHQALFQNISGTLTGAALALASPVLEPVYPGMVATVVTADGSLTQLLEIVSVSDASHALLSALRPRQSAPPVTPLAGGAVKVTLISFQPQIAAVGDELLALMGLPSDRAASAAPALSDLVGFRCAATYCTLAALYRTLTTTLDGKPVIPAKHAFYESLAATARRVLSATRDHTTLTPATPVLARP